MTDGTMIDVGALSGVIDADPASGLVTVGGGTVLADLNERLHEPRAGDGEPRRHRPADDRRLDLDRDPRHRRRAAQHLLPGGRASSWSSPTAASVELDADGDLLRAARVGVGALGAISAVTLRCVPAFTLDRVDSAAPPRARSSTPSRSEPTPTTTSSSSPSPTPTRRWSSSATAPTPRRGRAAGSASSSTTSSSRTGRSTRSRPPAGRFPAAIPRLSRLAARLASGSRAIDRSDRIFANERRVRFTEMEYGVPRENGPEAVRRVIEWVRGNRYPVFFPIEMRVTAADDALLSPSHERDTAYIAVHQYRGMEWRPYFEAVEEIMDEYGGRPALGQAPLPDRRDAGPALSALGRLPGCPRRARPRPRLRQRVRATRPRPLI